MDYTEVTNPVYGDADKKSIQCNVTFEGFANPLPFIAMADDPEPHGAQIFADLVAGKYGVIGAYVAPTVSPDTQYADALALGIVVTSSSTPALNGTYSVQTPDIANINAQAQFITMASQFTTGGTTMPWPDAAQALHTFPSTELFITFAKAALQYSMNCSNALAILRSGAEATFPSNKVTLD